MSWFGTAVAFILPSRPTVLCAAALAALGAAAPAEAVTRSVSTLGSDSAACTSAAPCRSFARAYAVAQAGDVVQVAAGSYPGQSVGAGSKAVTFRGGAGVVLRQMVNDASNVVYDGINVDAGATKTSGAAFELGGSGSTVRNASIGNVADEKAMVATGADLTVDNVDFHDAIYQTDGVHMECVYAIGVPGFTIRNSSFRDCAIMDLFFTYGNWWSPLPASYGNVTIENNVFAHPELERNGGWHYYSLYINFIGPNANSDPMSNWVIRNNTFESPAYVTPERGTNGTRWVGNVGSWDCTPGITYRYNVGRRCSNLDKAVSPASSTQSTPAAFGWANPAGYDFRLKAGSPAINAGDPADAPIADRDGLTRDTRPDAGAHEFGATRPPGRPGPGAPPAGQGGTTRGRLARLSSRTICLRRRQRCPAVARLRLSVSAPARVSVRVQRLQKGRKPRTALSFARRVRVKRTAKLRARTLGRGRYRVIVTAKDSGGRRTKARRLRLRVR